ncbi:MAG: DUF3501 family protein [Gammaproteobacteria bacterium]
MRFELSDAMVAAAREGARLSMGIDHDSYSHTVEALDDSVRDSLSRDLH